MELGSERNGPTGTPRSANLQRGKYMTRPLAMPAGASKAGAGCIRAGYTKRCVVVPADSRGVWVSHNTGSVNTMQAICIAIFFLEQPDKPEASMKKVASARDTADTGDTVSVTMSKPSEPPTRN
jgi:hypothetical protein